MYTIEYKDDKRPYGEWLKNKTNVIFQYHDHCHHECMHSIFLPSLDGNSGLYYFTLNGEYAITNLYANVLIDAERKIIYMYSVIFEYSNYGYKDIENGDIIQLRSGEYTENDIGYYEEHLKKFFGEDWIVSYNYTLKVHKKRMKKFRNKLNRIIKANNKFIPDQIKQIILIKCCKWINCTKISKDIQNKLLKTFETHGGKIPTPDGCCYYPWGKIIALYDN